MYSVFVAGKPNEANEPVGRTGYGWDVSDIRAGKTQSEGAD